MNPAHLRVMIYVQHLLGIGHLVRTLRIAKALAEGPFEVSVVSGGVPVSGLEAGNAKIIQLPAVRAGIAGFNTLARADGSEFTKSDQGNRCQNLLEHFAAIQPDILILEAFPFGRRQMRFEILPLLEQARLQQKPILIASSIRDILQEQKKPERIEETLASIEAYFDLVLVHGAPDIIRLEASFPRAIEFAHKIAYTGLVGAGETKPSLRTETHEVIVSVGGGAVGEILVLAALKARKKSSLKLARWLIVTGPNLKNDVIRQLEAEAGDGLTIARFLPDLADRLQGATLSISQAGYNTVADLLAAGCASVLVPFAGAGETEQTMRANLLQERKLAVTVVEADLKASTLASAMERALRLPRPFPVIKLDGAQQTGLILQQAFSRKQSSASNAELIG